MVGHVYFALIRSSEFLVLQAYSFLSHCLEAYKVSGSLYGKILHIIITLVILIYREACFYVNELLKKVITIFENVFIFIIIIYINYYTVSNYHDVLFIIVSRFGKS